MATSQRFPLAGAVAVVVLAAACSGGSSGTSDRPAAIPSTSVPRPAPTTEPVQTTATTAATSVPISTVPVSSAPETSVGFDDAVFGWGDAFSMTALLGEIPAAVFDDVEPAVVITIDAVDLVRLTEVLGTQRPPDMSDPDAVVNWLGQGEPNEQAPYFLVGHFLLNADVLDDPASARADIGFDLVDVDATTGRLLNAMRSFDAIVAPVAP